ncbi:Tubulin polyglutamylase TTLL6 [Orchesella cincta]|uniref:Tubulin polyglutamylase TTLL6 n=1 Tax=Orchesella cincta TaxID=48709 RepID=A0A1D2NHW0_ORCCI|nr:Tubulin polyglutamylase TTLL6 [Orchesella cincta]
MHVVQDEDSLYKGHPRRGSWSVTSLSTIRSILRNLFLSIRGRRMNSSNFLLGLLLLGTFLTYLNVTRLNAVINTLTNNNHEASGLSTKGKHAVKKFAVHGKRVDSGYLAHVFEAFERLGYARVNVSDENWDVLWSHDYPFRVLNEQLVKLKPSQKVNHFPGSGYITNKMNLATSDLAYVPKAFQIPKDKNKLMDYARKNLHKKFVQKSNNHRGIRIEKLEKLDLSKNGTFIQEYIGNPLLINGHKFDIGVYTVLTSINPLRIYIYRDVLFRFCPEQYHPFDPDVVEKYVVGDDYLPLWKVPDLEKYYNDLGFGMRDSFDAWYASKGKSPESVWAQVESAIRTIYLSKETQLIESTKRFPPGNGRNFFEMVRFDFVIDDEGKVYIMEANMSPNLSSAHFPPNRLLYEQVLFNILGLVGVGTNVAAGRSIEDTGQVASKQIAVFPKECYSEKCLHDCKSAPCGLCQNCLNEETIEILKAGFLEFVNRGECLRVFPPSNRYSSVADSANIRISEETLDNYDISDLSKVNQLQVLWFRGKCRMDPAFC